MGEGVGRVGVRAGGGLQQGVRREHERRRVGVWARREEAGGGGGGGGGGGQREGPEQALINVSN